MKSNWIKYISIFLLGGLFIYSGFSVYRYFGIKPRNEQKQELAFMADTAHRLKKSNNHHDGDDTFSDYRNLNLTDYDFNILDYLLSNLRSLNKEFDDTYIYINTNEKNEPKKMVHQADKSFW